jgi:PAS domain S-box-containing protein
MKENRQRSATRATNPSSTEDEALMGRIFDCALDIMGLVDETGRILLVNQAVRTQLGYDPATLTGSSILSLIHPDDLALVVEEINRTLNQTSTRNSIDVRCRHAEGSWRILEAVANPLAGEAKARLVITARDITLRKQDQALQQAQDAMEDAARNARTPLELFAAAHRLIGTLVPADNFFVALCEPKTGWLSFPYWVDRRDPGPPAHAPGTGLSEYVIKSNRALHVTPESLPGFLAGSGAEVLGSLPVEWIGYPLRAPEGPLGLMVLQTYDPGVTLGPYAVRVLETLAAPLALAANNLRQDEARQDSEQSYRALFSEMPTAFCIATLEDPADGRPAQARILECNRAMEQLWQRTRHQLLDSTLAEIVAPAAPSWLSQLAAINESDQPMLNVEWTLPARNQHLMVHLYRVGQDQIACLMEDVSARKQTEFAQRRHDALLEALAYAAGRFLHTPDWEGCIQDVLGALGRAADVSRVYLFENECTPQGTLACSQRYEWVAEGVVPHLHNPVLQKLDLEQIGLGAWQAEMKLGHLVAGSIAALPAREQELFSSQDVRCLLLMPILVSGYFWGFIGCDECRREREWLASERDAFRAIAQTLGEAIQRRNAEEAMQLRGVALASAANGIVITDHNGHILFVNQAFQQLTGYSAGEVHRPYAGRCSNPASTRRPSTARCGST